MFHAYAASFHYSPRAKVIPLLPPHAILSFDAALAFIKTLEKTSSRGQLPSKDTFDTALQKISFYGASGLIQFQGDKGISDPLSKRAYIMCEDAHFNLRELASYVPGKEPSYSKDFPDNGQIVNCGSS
jgi:hypothetical protein